MSEAKPFETERASDVPPATEEKWLVDQLWSESAIGFVAGEPKSYKSLFCLDLAVSVASGTKCLGTYAVKEPGPVLIYPAEDRVSQVRNRLDAIAAHKNVNLSDLEIFLLDSDKHHICLDGQDKGLESHCERIKATAIERKAKLIILDPLRRIMKAEENSSTEMRGVLDDIKGIRIETDASVMVVHHSRKPGPDGDSHAGHAMRGSSDLYSWVESFISIRSGGKDEPSTASVQHRYSPSPEDFSFKAVDGDLGAYVELVENSIITSGCPKCRKTDRLCGQVLKTISLSAKSVTLDDLRAVTIASNDRLRAAAEELISQGRVKQEGKKYSLVKTNGGKQEMSFPTDDPFPDDNPFGLPSE